MSTTTKDTKPSITRNGSKFTISWKIKAKNVTDQDARCVIYNGSNKLGTLKKDLGKKTTSYTFDLSGYVSKKITRIVFGVNVKSSGKTRSKYSENTFTPAKPATPTVTMEVNSANKTTFSWESKAANDGTGWYWKTQYRTLWQGKWSSWANISTSPAVYTETSVNCSRGFQVKNIGPAGEVISTAYYHYIGLAPIASWQATPVTYSTRSSYYDMTYNYNLPDWGASTTYIDDIVPQYFIGTPLANMDCPGNAGWTDGASSNVQNGKTGYNSKITTSDLIGDDECLWARIKTIHDSQDSYSSAYRIITGRLTAPTATISVNTPTASGFTVTVNNINAGTSVPGAYLQVFLERNSTAGKYELLGTIANGASEGTVTSSLDITGETGYAIHVRNVTADGKSMTSDYISYKTTMPLEPTFETLTATTTPGKVHLSWTHNWTAATGTVIAWTTDPDNWMSNDDPEQYEIHENVKEWFITGLNTGIKWYFRVRSMREDGDNVNYSSWSEDKTIDLASAPAVSTLYLSEQAITEDGMVTAYWSYATTDGTSQSAGNVVIAEYDDENDQWTYGESVGSTSNAQHIDIYAKDHNWTNGSIVYLALQTRASSGGSSDYSTPVPLTICAKPTVSMTCDDLEETETLTEYFLGDGETDTFLCASNMTATPIVTVDETAVTVSSYSGSSVTLASAPEEGSEVDVTYITDDTPILEAIPFTVTVETENAKNFILAIERAEDYPMTLPDDTETVGAAGETVYLKNDSAQATNTISIYPEDLMGRLDDTAYYDLVATVEDEYGQTDEARIRFRVHWAHQAWMPSATFETDTQEYIAKITPVAGEDYTAGDTCDIYRMSTDKPELIVAGGVFGTQYVDPYPAFGEFSGYKVVTITANDDFITPDNLIAQYDTTDDDESTYEQLNPEALVIDFGDQRIELPYDITLNNSWTKDFNRTTYLGGSVVGDHNASITRDLSASTVLVRNKDEETANDMRALSNYAGICHVRTPEGSSFAADIQVTEDMSFDTRKISYNLKISKVDPVGYDGMTAEEWSRR